MKYQKEEITLRDGRKVTFGSAQEKDAQQMIDFMKIIASETNFMLRYPEEVKDDLEFEKKIISDMLNNERGLFLTVFDGDRIVANSHISLDFDFIKMRHRCDFGIGIIQEYCDSGLGTIMMEKVIGKAKAMGFEQMELGVFADNKRAIALYKKMGFKEYGRLPKACKLKDGTYIDQVCMVLELS